MLAKDWSSRYQK